MVTRKADNKNFIIEKGVFAIPKRGKPEKGKIIEPDNCGDDSYNIFESEKIVALAVADGVGGGKKYGKDPAAISRTLMKKTGKIIAESGNFDMIPKIILNQARNQLIVDIKDKVDEKLSLGGSSTAILVLIDKATGRLNCANIGDSCLMAFLKDGTGNWKLKFRSRAETLNFNTPRQFNTDSVDKSCEDLELISEYYLQLEKGHVVLVMTDGVSDNMFIDEIAKVIGDTFNSTGRNAEVLAQNIALEAHKLSKLGQERKSPHTIEAKNYGKTKLGGKEDDITAELKKIT